MLAATPTGSSAERDRGSDGRGRVPELDGVRGLAILLVLVWHYFVNLIQPLPGTWLATVKVWLGLTWSGVDLFFVLSGYLLGGILLDQLGSANYYRTFYVRRACRILPIYVVLLLSVGAAMLAGPGHADGWREDLLGRPMPFWSYCTFTQNFFMARASGFGAPALGATWSLAVEEQFYLFLPLLIRLIPVASLPGALMLCILGAPMCRLGIWVMMDPTGSAGLVLMPARADSLLLGVLAAYMTRQPEFKEWIKGHRWVLHLALGVLGAGVLMLARFGVHVPPILAHMAGHTWLALFYGLILLLVPTGFPGWLFRGRLLGLLGTISYGVYLLHVPVLGLVHGWLRGQSPRINTAADAWMTIFALAVTIALAVVSWRWLEQPFLRLGRRQAYG